MDNLEQRYPEPTVGALVFNQERKLLLMRSHKWRDKLVVPGGHVELGESMEEALRREVKEETGLEVYDIELLCIQEFIYDDAFWAKRHFIFFDYVCKTDCTEVTLDSEAYDFIWVVVEEALELPIEPYTERAIKEYLKRYASRNGSSTA